MFAIALSLHAVYGQTLEQNVAPDLRDWVASDSPAVRYFFFKDKDLWSDQGQETRDFLSISPNGGHFFFVAEWGDLRCDCNVAQISIFSVSEVFRALRLKQNGKTRMAPLRSVTLRHRDYPMTTARWSDDSRTVLVMGSTGEESGKQLYRYELESGVLTQLTAISDKEAAAPCAMLRTAIMCQTTEFIPAPEPYPIYAMTAARVRELALQKGQRRDYHGHVYASFGGERAWELKSVSAYAWPGPWFSPDGRKAVVLSIAHDIPESWRRYSDLAANVLRPPESFAWVDLAARHEGAFFDAPIGSAVTDVKPRALWSSDSASVVLLNVALPPETNRHSAERTGNIVSYEFETEKWELLDSLRDPVRGNVTAVEWVVPGHSFVVRRSRTVSHHPDEVYSRTHRHWAKEKAGTVSAAGASEVKEEPAFPRGLKVELRQSANEPPRVRASLGSRHIDLTDPDPALQGIWLARIDQFSWRDSTGRLRKSGLSLPRKLIEGAKRFPLVIQADTYSPDYFRADGQQRSGFATQALAAKGFAVLNLDMDTFYEETSSSAPLQVSQFLDWVEMSAFAVAEQYPVDIDRVGLIAFSRGAYLARFTYTFPKRLRLAAAIMAAGHPGTYPHILQRYAMDEQEPGLEDVYGGVFYQSKKLWLQRELSFNVDRVQTPVLFMDSTDVSFLVDGADVMGAFEANRKPYEYLILPNGYHLLRSPRQREASVDATVDWMLFWLKGDVPADNVRADRWLVLRKRQQAVLEDLTAEKGQRGIVATD